MRQKLLHMDMIELINHGRAQLVYWENGEVLLRDLEEGTYFHSCPELSVSHKVPEKVCEAWKERGRETAIELIVLHQREMISCVEKCFDLHKVTECVQVVYTRREKLSIRGLYRTDGTREDGLVIRALGMEDFEQAAGFFETCGSVEYLKGRISRGAVMGAFYGDKLAGYIGIHGEGSIGMLNVSPEYRRRHIAQALETYAVNSVIECGGIPFGQVIVGNEQSMSLQKKLGLCFSGMPVYWME